MTRVNFGRVTATVSAARLADPIGSQSMAAA
jgi:hypothetical protein